MTNIETGLLDKASYTTQWYRKWEECFLDTCKFASHELVDQPLAFFYIISAEDENPDKEFQNLINLKSQLKRYREGTYDSDYPLVFIMLHDPNSNITADTAAMQADRLKKKYARGFNVCEMLSMSFKPNGGGNNDIWEDHLRFNRIIETDVFDNWDRKHLLTANDRESIKFFIKEIIDEKIIGTVASKIRQYENLVKNTKKGFTNMMKSFLNKKERSENEGLRKDFVMNNQEISMKNLTDLSFLFQDHKTYMSYSKYPMNDFKSIKAYKHLASCLELQFFTYLQNHGSYGDTREFHTNLFQAANTYSKSKEPRWMIRNMLMTAEICKVLNKFEEAAKCYLKIAYSFSQTSVIPALFFEQAAYCFLKIDQQRKFGFYIIKAGTVYENYDYKDYSFFCFGIAEPYYTKLKWNEIRKFLYTSLSESSFYFGNLQLSVKFFKNLLQLCCDIEDSNDGKIKQKEVLEQFFTVVK